MVRPMLTGVSRICEEVGSLPLDSDEKAGGEIAFSALLYQMGGQLDARVLVLLWCMGVTLPRVIHEMKRRNRKKVPAGTSTRDAKENTIEGALVQP